MNPSCRPSFARWVLASLLIAAWAIPASAVTIENYGPFRVSFYNNGEGGSDSGITGEQDWTAQQRADVATAIGAWDDRIDNVTGRQVELHVFWTELDAYGTNVLGGSSSYRLGDGATIWNAGEYVWKEGVNYSSPVNYDTYIQYDITAAGVGGGWSFGSGSPASNAIDFRSVITHELGHSVGFTDSYRLAQKDFGYLGIGIGYEGLTAWDSFLVDADGTKAPAGGGKARQFNATDDPVFWDGAIANTFYGQPVPIYAPDPFESGSSLAHVDETALPSALMSPSVSTGQGVRAPSLLEWKMMEDMGWDVFYSAGDFDLNMKVEDDDIDILCANMGGDPATYDLDGDNDVDEDDMIYLVEALIELKDGSGRVGTKRGDFNLDGLVNATDLALMNPNFGSSGLGYAGGNANCDTFVNATDLAILASNFGFAAPTGAIPEPASMAILGLAGLALLRRRRQNVG